MALERGNLTHNLVHGFGARHLTHNLVHGFGARQPDSQSGPWLWSEAPDSQSGPWLWSAAPDSQSGPWLWSEAPDSQYGPWLWSEAPDSQSGPWLWSEAPLAGNLNPNGSVESDARLSQLGLSWVPERTGRSARLASCYSITIPAVQFFQWSPCFPWQHGSSLTFRQPF